VQIEVVRVIKEEYTLEDCHVNGATQYVEKWDDAEDCAFGRDGKWRGGADADNGIGA
jgi:hypothetical protein